ncbi:MAG: hypothetical protein F6K58_23650 [Symploca sp. SIO2E9]|nr:hypothetical protein [Symploca sp. SIO2E9]
MSEKKSGGTSSRRSRRSRRGELKFQPKWSSPEAIYRLSTFFFSRCLFFLYVVA